MTKQETVENEYNIIRGKIDGKEKYCRIPVRSRTAELMQENNIAELSAEKILEMPHDIAAKTIDAIMEDWRYWLERAGELWVLWRGCQQEEVPQERRKNENEV